MNPGEKSLWKISPEKVDAKIQIVYAINTFMPIPKLKPISQQKFTLIPILDPWT